ncbi:MAG: magnesium transporter [Acholeplasma sp.]|nr:magnesium transporter [Acholeplasma sp.]
MPKKINFNKSDLQIAKQLSNMHALDIANELYDYDDEKKHLIIKLMPISKIDDVFALLDVEEALDFFKSLDKIKKHALLSDLSAADLKPLFEEFEEEDKESFLNELTVEKKTELAMLMHYDETKAASVMRSDYLVVKENILVSEAMKNIIGDVEDNDFIDSIFVVNDQNVLIGLIELRELIIARKNDEISSLINHKFEFVYDTDEVSKAIAKIMDYDINLIAVLNKDKEIMGIITADDVFEEMAQDYESNIDKFVAVGEFDEDSGPLRRVYQRLPWLLVSIVLNLLIALFLSVFSETIDTITALILFQPLILGMAGNIGTQAIAVTILALHKNTHDTKEKIRKHIRKEVFIGIINALIIGILGFVLSWVYLSLSNFDSDKNLNMVFLSLAIGLSLFFSMLLSAGFGVLIPIALSKMKVDPAAASGPVISTINDLVALLIYFGLATLIVLPMIS